MNNLVVDTSIVILQRKVRLIYSGQQQGQERAAALELQNALLYSITHSSTRSFTRTQREKMIEVFPIFLKKPLVGCRIFLADQNLRTRVPVGCAIEIAVTMSNLIGEVVSPSLGHLKPMIALVWIG